MLLDWINDVACSKHFKTETTTQWKRTDGLSCHSHTSVMFFFLSVYVSKEFGVNLRLWVLKEMVRSGVVVKRESRSQGFVDIDHLTALCS